MTRYWLRDPTTKGKDNGYVELSPNDKKVSIVLKGDRYISVDKRTARLLAKRITECLDDVGKRGKRLGRSVREKV